MPLKALAAARQHWEPLAPDVAGFMADLAIPQWNLQLRVMLYRKHVQHETPKNFQLDLFTPDDGHFEYYAVATNLALGLPALYAFVCGRGVQEKTFGELKGEFALDVVPTRDHRPHGTLTADATEPAWNGYLLTVACPCGVVFERWITPGRSRRGPAPLRIVELGPLDTSMNAQWLGAHSLSEPHSHWATYARAGTVSFPGSRGPSAWNQDFFDV